jgi:hypothetical protein
VQRRRNADELEPLLRASRAGNEPLARRSSWRTHTPLQRQRGGAMQRLSRAARALASLLAQADADVDDENVESIDDDNSASVSLSRAGGVCVAR